MPDIVGIRFKKAGKVYYFEPGGTELKVSDYVVVQTARGVEMGQVMIAPRQVLAAEIIAELKPITRKASPEDVKRAQDFTAKEALALKECAKIIAKINLAMKLVSAEYNLDGTRLTFYFTAEERVDFRELVRDLTSFFKTRIELRQIGPRDQAKIVGGLGRCGRPLCCGSFLTEFTPVSIKMAKEQDLPLDPMKISGVCGRLQCCLAYESAQYREAKALMPRKGQPVETPAGKGFITGVFPLKETVMVELETQTSAEFPLAQIKLLDNVRPQITNTLPAEEIKETAGNGALDTPKDTDQPAQSGVAPGAGVPSNTPLSPVSNLSAEVEVIPPVEKAAPMVELAVVEPPKLLEGPEPDNQDKTI
jgi:cell fate regulator YaaT (PSP1 superfamily)